MFLDLIYTIFHNRFVKKFDLLTLGTVLLITFLGLVSLYSATYSYQTDSNLNFLSSNFNKQLVWVTLGLIILVLINLMPMKWLYQLSYSSYIVSIVLLVLVYVLGYVAGGARSWFNFGSVRFQPSEIAKIALILTLARFLVSKSNFNFSVTFTVCGIVGLPLILVLIQPDLGSCLAFISVTIPMIFWAGFSPLILFLLATPLVSLVSGFISIYFLIAWLVVLGIIVLVFAKKWKWFLLALTLILNFGISKTGIAVWGSLHPYQQKRITTFLDPESDKIGAGYQVLQSLTAIGSGGFFGKGFLEGTQTQLRFLPEQHTDFIFSVFAEEWGFLGVSTVLVLFLVLCLRILSVALRSDDRFKSLVAIGIWGLLVYHVFVNIGMIAGVMPVTGLPLPFFSYGGSFYLSMSILTGILIRVSQQSYAD
ncbi:rod shape-determining protein RodA [bacterium]|nr:rod shape-determining protein RodA [bacterium]